MSNLNITLFGHNSYIIFELFVLQILGKRDIQSILKSHVVYAEKQTSDIDKFEHMPPSDEYKQGALQSPIIMSEMEVGGEKLYNLLEIVNESMILKIQLHNCIIPMYNLQLYSLFCRQH